MNPENEIPTPMDCHDSFWAWARTQKYDGYERSIAGEAWLAAWDVGNKRVEAALADSRAESARLRVALDRVSTCITPPRSMTTEALQFIREALAGGKEGA